MSYGWTPSQGTEEVSLYVDSVEITEFVPSSLGETQVEAAVLHSFLRLFSDLLYILIQSTEEALREMTSDHVAYPKLEDIASAADRLESATKRLRCLVEGFSGFRGTGTILVADDEEKVRDLVVKDLNDGGYTAFGVSSGSEAIAKLKGYSGTIHLLLADVAMEPMDGYELVRKVLLERPKMKAIYMSGSYPDHRRTMPGTAFLLKPDELRKGLRQRVRELLNRP